MLLSTWFAGELARFKVSVVATDVNPDILEAARRGVYDSERLREAPADLVAHMFTPVGERYQLRPEIRQMVDFRQGDIFDEASFTESDLILCRNLLIYFDRPVQEQIIHGLATALRTDGILVLGKAESLVGGTRRRFTTVCPIERIYQKSRLSLS
jgi:chemotaxis protein methyltransferase CheR